MRHALAILISAASLIVAPGPATAQTSSEYAEMSNAAVSHLECALLATPEDAQRHYDQSVRLLDTFKEAARSGLVDPQDLYDYVPEQFWGMGRFVASNEFHLGVLHEELSLKHRDLFRKGSFADPQEYFAQAYRAANCGMIR
ncbi:hypothetical protein SAMN05216456_1578 [Devosia crocina]|uniref:Uncharacterized protein n=1 Tax=Devosia crocina TaxID=429728 RepID=A0A1I7NC52_9HYPH|nr:hypothetical protein [Devosia crocina]SFV32229.1 hypothetical protein SAMN05216456_1578 [Devosia crocina]